MRNPNRGNPLNISINNNSNKIVYKATDTLTNLHLTIHTSQFTKETKELSLQLVFLYNVIWANYTVTRFKNQIK